MLYLTLTDIPVDGGPARQLGTVKIRQERLDLATNVAAYAVESEGQRVATISGWRTWHGPWRLAQAVLDTLYGGLKPARDASLRDDNCCNAITARGRRCRLEVKPGRYYCIIHDRL